MHIISRLLLAVAVAALAIGALTACGHSNASGGVPSTVVAPKPLSGDLTVFAASSLTDAFEKEKDAFESAHPGVSITFNFAGSPTLVTQLDQGAEADVLATADKSNMQKAYDEGLMTGLTQVFARNKLAVIVPKDNPANITTPYELGKPGLRLVLAQESVPAGDYARQVFRNMEADPSGGPGLADAILSNVISNEANVRAVVTKVQLGEADAGVAYATDATSDVTLLPIADDLNVLAMYPIAVMANARHADLARAFIDFLLSSAGQRILTGEGFLPAP